MTISPARLLRVSGSFQTYIDDWGLSSVALDDLVVTTPATPITNTQYGLSGKDAGALFQHGFVWGSNENTSGWYPQGLSGSGDAYGSDLSPSGKKWLVCTWHNSDDSRTRVTLVNITDPENPVYRNILLVEPYLSANGPSFRDVAFHAGGCVWYGNLLFVANSGAGFRVFDMNQIKECSSGDANLIGKHTDGLFYAHNYLYALPQVLRYNEIIPFDTTFSFCGLAPDTTGDNILTGTYALGTTNLFWWPLNEYTKDLVIDNDNRCQDLYNFFTNDNSLQGGIGNNANVFLSSGNTLARRSHTDPSLDQNFSWPTTGLQGLTYFPNSDELWSCTEASGNRIVFCVLREDLL